MKKILFLCLSFSVLIFCNFSANASEVVYENEEKEIIENLIIVSSDTIYLNDGSYITTTLYSSISNNARSSSYTNTGSKDVVKQNGDGSIV